MGDPATLARPRVTPAARPAGSRAGIDRFELGLLVVFGALSMWAVGSDLVIELSRGWHWTDTDGWFSGDQLQYLSWIQSSAHHGLISDLFVLRATRADYFQPAIMLSALLVRLGVAPWLALMLWKPVAVVGLFLAARALVHHCLARRVDRRAALVLALLFASLTDIGGSVGVIGDMMSVWQSWGYPFGLIGVALITVGLLRYAAARDAGRVAWAPGLLGGLAGTIHPWQGELMFGAVLLAELVRLREPGPRGARLRLAVLTLGLVALPLLYYFGLGHLDPVWRMGQAHARHTFSSTAVLIAAAPLLAFALLGLRGRPTDFLELLLRMWVPATLVIWVFSTSALGATPLHAVNGLPLPLAVLAVLGVRRAGLDRLPHAGALGWLAVAVGTVPAIAWTMAESHTYTNPTSGNANFITHDESRALAWLRASPIPGGVLSGFYLGEAIPGLTGRQDFVGDCLWSEPNCFTRSQMVDRLFSGRLTDAGARRLVADSGARFLLGGCAANRQPATRQLAPLTVAVRRFGCATVWQLRPSGPARGPLAAARPPVSS
jgi:hypothetical protein